MDKKELEHEYLIEPIINLIGILETKLDGGVIPTEPSKDDLNLLHHLKTFLTNLLKKYNHV